MINEGIWQPHILNLFPILEHVLLVVTVQILKTFSLFIFYRVVGSNKHLCNQSFHTLLCCYTVLEIIFAVKNTLWICICKTIIFNCSSK